MRPFILLITIAIIGIGLWLRFTGLTQSPPGFYVDEASIAENAYQVFITGKDEWGIFYPVYFKAFGEYKNPLFIYSLVPMYWLLGVSINTVRLTAGLWGLATVVVTGVAVWSLTRKPAYVLLAAVVGLYLPWHFHSSRVAFEAVTLPFFCAAILATLINYWQFFRFHWLFFGTVLTGLMFYTYTPARIFSPLLFFLLCLYALKKHSSRIPVLILAFFLCLLPALVWNQTYPNSLFTRYHQTANKGIGQIITTYLYQYHPQLWFLSGDSNLRHSPGKGLLPLSLAPLFFIGLYHFFISWRKPLSLLILAALITAPIPAALTRTDPNALRMIHLIPVLIMVIIKGIQVLFTSSGKRAKLFLAILTACAVYEHLVFIQSYYRDFPARSSWWFDAPLIQSYSSLHHYNRPVWVHNDLFADGHYITTAFLCHAGLGCPNPSINFSGDSLGLTPDAVNVYFEHEHPRIIP